MFWNKIKTRKPNAVRSSKLRMEILEDRRLLTAVGWNALDNSAEVCDVASATESIALPLVTNGTNELVVTTTADELNKDGLDAATNDANGLSFREAIYYADAGATITFKDSLKGATITLDGTQLEIAKSLTIDAPKITLDAGGKSRVMNVSFADSDASRTLTFNGLTLTNGNADYGAGLCVSNGTVNATNVKISGNTATKFGGGVAVNGGKFNAINAEISGNKADWGDGVCVEGGEFKATNATIADNDGDGVYVKNGKTATLNNSIVVNNSNTDIFRVKTGLWGLDTGYVYGHNTLSTFTDWE